MVFLFILVIDLLKIPMSWPVECPELSVSFRWCLICFSTCFFFFNWNSVLQPWPNSGSVFFFLRIWRYMFHITSLQEAHWIWPFHFSDINIDSWIQIFTAWSFPFLINLSSNGFHVSFKHLLYKYLSAPPLSTCTVQDTGVIKVDKRNYLLTSIKTVHIA